MMQFIITKKLRVCSSPDDRVHSFLTGSQASHDNSLPQLSIFHKLLHLA